MFSLGGGTHPRSRISCEPIWYVDFFVATFDFVVEIYFAEIFNFGCLRGFS